MAQSQGTGVPGVFDQGQQHKRISGGGIRQHRGGPGRDIGAEHLLAELVHLGPGERLQVELRQDPVIPEGQEFLGDQQTRPAGGQDVGGAGGDGLRNQLRRPAVQALGVVDDEERLAWLRL